LKDKLGDLLFHLNHITQSLLQSAMFIITQLFRIGYITQQRMCAYIIRRDCIR